MERAIEQNLNEALTSLVVLCIQIATRGGRTDATPRRPNTGGQTIRNDQRNKGGAKAPQQTDRAETSWQSTDTWESWTLNGDGTEEQFR